MEERAKDLDIETRFLQHPTSAVSDAMDELGLMGVLPNLNAVRVGQGRAFGRAMTARLDRKTSDPDAWRFGGGVGKPLEQVLQKMKSGDVVVMDLGGAMDASAWGGAGFQISATARCSCDYNVGRMSRRGRNPTDWLSGLVCWHVS